MLLRIEKHFKAEQVARRKAEEQAASAEAQIAEERELREKAQLELKNRMHEGERNAALKAALAAERGALEAEKAKVEAEIEEAPRRRSAFRRGARPRRGGYPPGGDGGAPQARVRAQRQGFAWRPRSIV